MGADVDLIFDDDGTWIPPETFRQCAADTERLAGQLLEVMRGQLVISVAEVEFTARRLHQLARVVRESIPAGVS